jgi:hypothetical protein
MPEEQLRELGARIEGLEKGLWAIGNEAASLRHETNLLVPVNSTRDTQKV